MQNPFDARGTGPHTRTTMRTEFSPELPGAPVVGVVSIILILPL